MWGDGSLQLCEYVITQFDSVMGCIGRKWGDVIVCVGSYHPIPGTVPLYQCMSVFVWLWLEGVRTFQGGGKQVGCLHRPSILAVRPIAMRGCELACTVLHPTPAVGCALCVYIIPPTKSHCLVRDQIY